MADKANRRVKSFAVVVIIVAIALINPPAAHADILRGLLRVVGGVLEVPRSALVGTFSGPPVFGTVVGMLAGAVNGVGMVVGGGIEVAASIVPLAMKAAPLIPIFI